jgi:hypothetical protein
MQNLFLTTDEAASLIETGRPMIIAGSEACLRVLPKGQWIGGTSYYFVTDEGGRVARDRLFCTVLDPVSSTRIVVIGPDNLDLLTSGSQENGYAIVLLPAFSKVLGRFATEGADLPNLFDRPLAGWVAGTHLDDGDVKPKVVDGSTGAVLDDAGVLMMVALDKTWRVELDIINPFTPGDGLILDFPERAFTVTDCAVGGKTVNLANFMRDKNIDSTLPLIGDCAGVDVNVSIRRVDGNSVALYAPVMPGVHYRFARPLADYAAAFDNADATAAHDGLSCNCILNFLHGDLIGRKTGAFRGPATFGEVGYILLNQTLVHLNVVKCAVG